MNQDRDETPDIKLAGLSVWVSSREFPDSDDYWDGNWLHVHIHVEADGASVQVSGPCVRTDEIEEFTEQLALLHRDLRGTANLACMEPYLAAKVTCGTLGGVQVEVEVTPDHLAQSHRFLFGLDQSYLPAVLSGCRDVLHRFPVTNRPR